MSPTVQLLVTCIVDTLYPETGESVVRLLEKAGVQVNFPLSQTCCGQPAFNAGLRPLAREMAEHTIRVFEETEGDVIIPSGSCASMVRHGYLELFAGDEQWLPRAEALAARTYELTEYLVDVLHQTDFQAKFPGKVTYHASCHLLRELGVSRQPRQLLSQVTQAELVELPEAADCCGFGGVFSVEHPELSTAMMQRKIERIQQSQAEVVVVCDAGCITHINGGLRRQGLPEMAVHIARFLDQNGGEAV